MIWKVVALVLLQICDFHGDQSEVALILEAYGWLPPIDDPKLGFGRGNLYHRDAMVRLAGYMRLHGHSC